MMMRIMMIKNLTQIFGLGFLAGILLILFFLLAVNKSLGLYLVWIVLDVITIFSTITFYKKLKRCQSTWED
jgi:Na+-driven multidrug efflux pump